MSKKEVRKLAKAKLMERYDEIARGGAAVTRMVLKVDENGEVWIEEAEVEETA